MPADSGATLPDARHRVQYQPDESPPHLLSLGFGAQATLMMRWLGIRLEPVSEDPVGARRALLRTLVMLIPFEVNHFFMVWANSPEGIPNRLSLQYAVVGSLILAYMVSAALSPRRESIHDWVAGTVVVNTRVA